MSLHYRSFALLLGIARTLAAAPLTFTQIDYPGSLSTDARGINNDGDIVGSYDSSHGYLLSGGIFTTIDRPGALETRLKGINNAGQIVGTYNNEAHSFVLSGGTFTTIDFPGALLTIVSDIND